MGKLKKQKRKAGATGISGEEEDSRKKAKKEENTQQSIKAVSIEHSGKIRDYVDEVIQTLQVITT